MQVLVIDYGMGNLKSVCRAIVYCGHTPKIVESPSEIIKGAKVILPGVGAFSDGMAALKLKGFDDELKQFAEARGHLLGICLGMQMLATLGEENGLTTGLDIIPGKVKRLGDNQPDLRLPHVGWNNVNHRCADSLFQGIPTGADFYFVHSYFFSPKEEEDVLGTAVYGSSFPAIVRRNNVYGVQFHPEKSQKYGLQMLSNFLSAEV